MNSKAWNILVLAPLMLVLTACGGDKKAGIEEESQFYGVWGSDARISAYRAHFGQHQNDFDGFCYTVLSNPQKYGISQNGGVTLGSFVVLNDGQVLTYSVNNVSQDAFGSQERGDISLYTQSWGHIAQDGTFSRSQASDKRLAGVSFQRVNHDTLVLKRGPFSRQRGDLTYFRSNEIELRGYANAVTSCVESQGNDSRFPKPGKVVPLDPGQGELTDPGIIELPSDK